MFSGTLEKLGGFLAVRREGANPAPLAPRPQEIVSESISHSLANIPGDEAIIENLVSMFRQIGIDTRKGVIIEVQDGSSSIEIAKDFIPTAQAEHYEKLSRKFGRKITIFQLLGQYTVRPMSPGPVELKHAHRYTKAELSFQSPGGILKGGASAIPDWMRAACLLGIALRRMGVKKVMVDIITDGWPYNPAARDPGLWLERSEASLRTLLPKTREAGVAIHLSGFVDRSRAYRLRRFVAAVGLKPEEVSVVDVDLRDPDSVERSVKHTFAVRTQVTGQTFVG